jgi:hypothetical protein
MLPPFLITVTIDRKDYRLKVELIHQTKQIQQFRVSAGGRSIVIQTNGPLFKNKGLKHRKGQWKLIEGGVSPWRESAVKEICETVQEWLDLQEKK